MTLPQEKIETLETILKGLESVFVAFSGGVDSTFLVAAARSAPRRRALAVTAISASYPDGEVDMRHV